VPKPTNLPRVGVFKPECDENDIPEYEPLHNVCGVCDKPITQWRHHPAASYAHDKTGTWACDRKFWTIPMAYPKEAEANHG